jgi:hypothetical protein
MEKYYCPVFMGKRLPVGGMQNVPIIGATLDFSSYSLNSELPAIKFKVVGEPVKTTPMTYAYRGRDYGWTNDYEVYEFPVEVEES